MLCDHPQPARIRPHHPSKARPRLYHWKEKQLILSLINFCGNFEANEPIFQILSRKSEMQRRSKILLNKKIKSLHLQVLSLAIPSRTTPLLYSDFTSSSLGQSLIRITKKTTRSIDSNSIVRWPTPTLAQARSTSHAEDPLAIPFLNFGGVKIQPSANLIYMAQKLANSTLLIRMPSSFPTPEKVGRQATGWMKKACHL